jgi:hypothetical protein
MSWLGHGDHADHAGVDTPHAGVGGWVKHELSRLWSIAAPKSEDFLPMVLDLEKQRRAAWAKRDSAGHHSGSGRAS